MKFPTTKCIHASDLSLQQYSQKLNSSWCQRWFKGRCSRIPKHPMQVTSPSLVSSTRSNIEYFLNDELSKYFLSPQIEDETLVNCNYAQGFEIDLGTTFNNSKKVDFIPRLQISFSYIRDQNIQVLRLITSKVHHLELNSWTNPRWKPESLVLSQTLTESLEILTWNFELHWLQPYWEYHAEEQEDMPDYVNERLRADMEVLDVGDTTSEYDQFWELLGKLHNVRVVNLVSTGYVLPLVWRTLELIHENSQIECLRVGNSGTYNLKPNVNIKNGKISIFWAPSGTQIK